MCFQFVARVLAAADVPQGWSRNPKLFCLLARIDRADLFSQFLDSLITDYWLPLQKITLRKFVKDNDAKFFTEDAKLFIEFQNAWFDTTLRHPFTGKRWSITDPDSLELKVVKTLGAGGSGHVHSVIHRPTSRTFAMKTMERPTTHQNILTS